MTIPTVGFRIVGLDGCADSVGQARRLFFDIGPDVPLVIHQGHGLGLSFREAHEKDDDGVDKDGLHDYEAPAAVAEKLQFQVLFEGQMLLEGRSVRYIF
jgi:hypothetical protein